MTTARTGTQRPLALRVALTTILVIGVAATAPAATAQVDGSRAPIDVQSLQAQIELIEANNEPTESDQRLLELLRKTLGHLKSVESSESATEAYRRARKTAPREANALRAELDEMPSPISLGIPEDAPLAEIERAALEKKASLAAAEADLEGLDETLASERLRPSEIRSRLAEANQQRQEIAADLVALPPSGRDALADARRTLLEAHASALTAEIRMLDEELLSQPIRLDLLEIQRDTEAAKVERIRTRARQLGELVVERRQADTEQVLDEAEEDRREAEGKHPLIADLAARNAELTQETATVTTETAKLGREQERASERAKRVAEEYRSARQKLEVAGVTQALGMVLLDQVRSLPNPQTLQKRAKSLEEEIAVASLRQIQYEEESRRLRDPDERVADLTTDLSPAVRSRIAVELTDLVEKRRDLLREAISAVRLYVGSLGELEFTQRRLLEAVTTYDDYLDERLLWVRSSLPFGVADLRAMPAEIGLLASPARWRDAFGRLAFGAPRSPTFLLLVAVFGILLWKRRALRSALAETGKSVGRLNTDHFSLSLEALSYTVLLAATWPVLLLAVGWQLQLGLDVTSFSTALSKGLLWVAGPLFAYQFFRTACRPGGLAEMHLSVAESTRGRLRRGLDRLMILWLPAGFLVVFFFNHEGTASSDGMERLFTVVATVALGLFLHSLLEPSRGILPTFLSRTPTSLPYRLRFVWFALGLAVPVLLVGLALVGYLLTASTLLTSLSKTIWLLLALLFAHELGVRWLTLARRQLEHQAFLDRRAAARAAGTESATAPSELAMPEEERPIDVAALSDETQKLLGSALQIAALFGLWLIWRDLIPALGVLDQVTLWEQVSFVSGEERASPITLGDAALAVLIAVVTGVAARRLPSLLEILFLQHLQMSPASHYTVVSLSRYFIAGVGGALAVGAIGFSWSQVQWLVAALGVGIGFGLQEIVANFISGLIILFERPIRVGDVVTVGDADGVVTRIQIRATTIRTWDRKELLVPNKEFVTGRLLNWSLSDQTTRIVIGVGVAYGSDVQKAMALVAEAAEENGHVLGDPRPFVVFDGFGDNALSLTLRCYVGNLGDRLVAISEIHQAINDRLNDAGITIAFPQRDVHFDPSRPLEIRLRRGPPEEERTEES